MIRLQIDILLDDLPATKDLDDNPVHSHPYVRADQLEQSVADAYRAIRSRLVVPGDTFAYRKILGVELAAWH